LDCGGAVYVSGDNNIINDSNYYNNQAFGDGGAIFLVGAECCVNNSYFESNSADEDGGAIYSRGTNGFNIDNCTFSDNAAGVYGGAVVTDSYAVVNSSKFNHNSALAAGAIFSKDMLNISDSLFNENSAEVGGAIVLNDDTGIVNSNITNNSGSNGGAIAVLSDSTLEINGTQFKGNLADLGSNNIVLISDATVTADNKTTSDSPLALKSVTLSPIYDENITQGDALQIMVYVDFGNAPMENGNVATNLDGKTYTAPVKDGFAFFNITGLNPGNYSSYLTFTQEGYVNATVEYNFTVAEKAPAPAPALKDAEITANSVSFVINYAKSYSITLKDSTGKVISGKKITFILNGKNIGSAYTNSNGVASLKVTSKILKVAKAGTRKLTVNLDDNVEFKSVSKTVNVKINKEKTKLVAKKKTFKAKTKVKKYTVTLKNSKGKAIKSAKLTLKVKGKTYKAKTNKKGKATFKIKKLTKKGKHKAVIKFKTTKYYKATSKKVKITVKK
jgi:predicted outer membrane repeat protein